MPPICRAKKGDLFTPGTLLKDGRCRIGFGYSVIKYTENVELLGFYSCSVKKVKNWF